MHPCRRGRQNFGIQSWVLACLMLCGVAQANTSTNPPSWQTLAPNRATLSPTLHWGDLELNHAYLLAQRLSLATGLWVRAGATLQIVQIESLAPVPVFRFEAVIQNCGGSMIDREAPLRVVRSGTGLEFGIELERGAAWESTSRIKTFIARVCF
jgi:hypothetical protein